MSQPRDKVKRRRVTEKRQRKAAKRREVRKAATSHKNYMANSRPEQKKVRQRNRRTINRLFAKNTKQARRNSRARSQLSGRGR